MGTEWQITDMATHAFGLVSVAMYDSLGADMTGQSFTSKVSLPRLL